MALTNRTSLNDFTGDAYASLADVDAFAERRGEAEWAAATEQRREASIIRATDYLDTRFSFSPDVVGVPAGVVRATAFLALAALGGKLFIDPTSGLADGGTAGGAVIAKTESVGPITETIRYAAPTSGSAGVVDTEGVFRIFPVVDGWLKPFLAKSATGGAGVVFTRRT